MDKSAVVKKAGEVVDVFMPQEGLFVVWKNLCKQR